MDESEGKQPETAGEGGETVPRKAPQRKKPKTKHSNPGRRGRKVARRRAR